MGKRKRNEQFKKIERKKVNVRKAIAIRKLRRIHIKNQSYL